MEVLSKQWSPEGFERYLQDYPNTPELNLPQDKNYTQNFIDTWNCDQNEINTLLGNHAPHTTVVFVRGFLGGYMPGNLKKPCEALKLFGFDSFVAKNLSGGTVAENVLRISQELKSRTNRQNIVFCGHSRGGLECLMLLAQDEEIESQCKGVLLSQTPHGPSFVMESILHGLHRNSSYSMKRRAAEKMQYMGLLFMRATRGGDELTSRIWPSLVRQVEEKKWTFPIFQTASWSIQPTAWLDSFHERLCEIFPGRAHDGQFFLDDLIWPELNHILLPHVDHAQPVVGGFEFDNKRYWLSKLAMVLK